MQIVPLSANGTKALGVRRVDKHLCQNRLFCYLTYFQFLFIAQRKDARLTREQESRLPSHWLKSKGAHTTMVDALWRLRDLMMRDTLSIRQAYNL